MWQEIRLRSLGVIESAELEFDSGLTVITGETGAGKTMVVTALGLLRGGRSDAGLVRYGDQRMQVEAVVDVSDLPEIADLLRETPGEIDDDQLLLGRTVTGEGRSRAFAGGASVPAGILGRISDHLVAVHGQSDQHRLLRSSAQRAALDEFAGDDLAALLGEYRPAHTRLREVRATLDELTTQARERARELDVLAFGHQEIEEVAPEAGEDDSLAAEEERLAHAEGLAQAAARAHEALSGDATSPDATDALSLASRAQGEVNAVREHDRELDAVGGRLDEVNVLLAELAAELSSYAESIDVDPARLASVQERRAALAGLTRKYGATLDDVIAWSQDAARRIEELSGDDERVETLTAEEEQLTATLMTLAGRLSALREEAATRLSTTVSAELEALAMPHARVEIEVRPPEVPAADDLGPDGYDQVELLLAANAGAAARPLGKGASGGELSRVMLALEVALAGHGSIPTYVFDEVDAGIGGKAAVEVGRRLARLARHAQVIVVTHLPQVAAFADRHYHVVKADDGSITTSGVHRLEADGRVAELSRMLAGLEGSASAEAHARELLEVADVERTSAA